MSSATTANESATEAATPLPGDEQDRSGPDVASLPAMPARRSGAVALVTGAAGNIGRAVALGLVRSGVRVVLADLASAGDGLDESRELCLASTPENAPAEIDPVISTFDVTDFDDVASSIEQVAADVGPPTLVFNNAGYQGHFANLVDYDLDDMRLVLDVNIAGVFAVLQASARVMKAAGVGGSIVNMASMAGVSGAPNMSAYSASKAAVIGLTKSAAKDLAPLGIRVNAVSPGFIGPGVMWDRQVELQASVPSQYYADTIDEVAAEMIDMVPLRRYGTLDEVAGAVLFLLSDAAGYVNGVNLEISGGGA